MKSDDRARRQLELIAEYRRTGSETAFQELLKSVRGTIGAVIKRYAGSQLPTAELSAEATIGFMLALGGYSPEQGPFANVVYTFVNRVLYEFAHQNGQPVSSAKGRVERALRIHGSRLYRECLDAGIPASVSIDLVAESMGYDPRHVAAAMALYQRVDWSLDTDGASDDPDDEGRAGGLADDGEQPDEALERADRVRVIEELIAELTPRQADVVRQRFLGHDEITYRELGEQYNRSLRSMSRTEKEALEAMRIGLEARGLSLSDLI